MRRATARFLWTACILSLSVNALAQGSPPPDGNKELAREWANKAKERYDAGDYQGAIDGIREAEKHARPPTFTRLSALAHERLGKLVEAQRLHQSVADLTLAKDAPEAWVNAKAASETDLKALALRIPKLEIVVSGASAPDLELTLDGAPFDIGQLGRAVPQNPGVHTVVVRGRGRAPVTRSVELREGATERVEIAVPAPSRPPPGPKALPPSSSPPGSGVAVPPALRIVAFGVGGAGLIAGAVTGGLVLGEMGKLGDGSCIVEIKKCDAGSKAGVESLGLLADISTASFIAGGVFVAAGVVLSVLPGKKQPSVGVAVSPSSLSVWGDF